MYKGAMLLVFCTLAMTLAKLARAQFPPEIYAGNPCRMEDGGAGICTRLPDCPMRVQQVINRERFSTSPGRCSFEGHVEIVCCPKDDTETTREMARLPSTSGDVQNDRSGDASGDEEENPMDHLDRYDCEDTRENEVVNEVTPQILSGKDALYAEFPYMVALGYPNGEKRTNESGATRKLKYGCGGTLVSTRHVLTAAHCVRNVDNNAPVEAKLGAIDLNDNTVNAQNIPIGEIIVHPEYRRSVNYNDLAILKLKRAVRVASNAKPICLQRRPLAAAEAGQNRKVVASGWGVMDFEGEPPSLLQKTPGLRLVDRANCSAPYADVTNRLPRGIDESLICALDDDATRRADTCQGDSGGPLLLVGENGGSSRLIGVTSFGKSCGSSVPAVYVNVDYYLGWIRSVILQ